MLGMNELTYTAISPLKNHQTVIIYAKLPEGVLKDKEKLEATLKDIFSLWIGKEAPLWQIVNCQAGWIDAYIADEACPCCYIVGRVSKEEDNYKACGCCGSQAVMGHWIDSRDL